MCCWWGPRHPDAYNDLVSSWIHLSTVINDFCISFTRWKTQERKKGRQCKRNVSDWKWTETEAAKSQPFHPASASISGEDIFPPTVSDTRRTRLISEGTGNDGASDKKLVSKPAISEKTSCKRKPESWRKTGLFNVYKKWSVNSFIFMQ